MRILDCKNSAFVMPFSQRRKNIFTGSSQTGTIAKHTCTRSLSSELERYSKKNPNNQMQQKHPKSHIFFSHASAKQNEIKSSRSKQW